MVIPSYYMVNSGPDKDALIEEYEETLEREQSLEREKIDQVR